MRDSSYLILTCRRLGELEPEEKRDISCSGLVINSDGGNVKEEIGLEGDRVDVEALREWERVWECLGPLKEAFAHFESFKLSVA